MKPGATRYVAERVHVEFSSMGTWVLGEVDSLLVCQLPGNLITESADSSATIIFSVVVSCYISNTAMLCNMAVLMHETKSFFV